MSAPGAARRRSRAAPRVRGGPWRSPCRPSQGAAPGPELGGQPMPGAGGPRDQDGRRSCEPRAPAGMEEEGRPGGRGGERRGREGRGRIDSLSSTGTTELSCHGERGAAGTARGGRRRHMPEGRRQQNQSPPASCCSLPQTRPLGHRGWAGRGTGPTQGGKGHPPGPRRRG